MIPAAFNPIAFDRYAYVFNSPLNNVDPSGHRTCSARQAATGDETCDQNLPPCPGICGKELKQWEIIMLVVAIMGESSGEVLPDKWLRIIVWTYLNRLTKGTQETLWEALKGTQSALYCYYQGGPECNESGKPIYPGLPSGPSESELETYFNNLWNDRGTIKGDFDHLYGIVLEEYESWRHNGTGSAQDWARGNTDFRIKYPDAIAPKPGTGHQESLDVYNARLTDPYWMPFSFFVLGPYYFAHPVDPRIWLFVSNISESNKLHGR